MSKPRRKSLSFFILCMLLLSFLPTNTILAASPAAQPAQLGRGSGITPKGTVEGNPIVFTWAAEPNADEYWLWIDRDHAGGLAWDGHVMAEEAGCQAGEEVCSFALPDTLENGDYVWWILPMNRKGYGQWSAPIAFTLGGNSTPEDLIISQPQGEIVTDTLAWPVAKWNHIEGAVVYVVWLSGPGIDTAVKHYVYTTWGEGCVDGTCSVQLNSASYPIQYNTEYKLTVNARSDYGEYQNPNDIYDFSLTARATFHFTSGAITVPEKPVGIGQSVSGSSVELSWESAPQAERYWLWIDGPSGRIWDDWVNAADLNCAQNTEACRFTPPDPLTAGQHNWWVLAANSKGYSPWSDPMPFNPGQDTNPTEDLVISYPNGEIVTDTLAWPVAAWNHIEGARVYVLWLSGPGIDTPVKHYAYATWGDDCVDGTCRMQLNSASYPIQYDTQYGLTIQARSDSGEYQDPNDEYNFSIDAQSTFYFTAGSTSIPEKPIGIGQSASGSSVELSWESDPQAQRYWLWIDGPNGRIWDDWVDAADLNCAQNTEACRFTPPEPLTEGHYAWWVLAANSKGNSPWSDPMHFDFGGNSTPTEDLVISYPNGEIVTDTLAWPVAEWNHIEGAVVYIVWLRGPGIDIPVKHYVYTTWGEGCMDGTCRVQLNSASYPIQYDNQYGLTVQALSDYGEYQDPNDDYNFSINAQSTFYFTANTAPVPGKGVGISPDNTTEANPVKLVWQADPYAAFYNLSLEKQDQGKVWSQDNITPEEANCLTSSSGNCYLLVPIDLDPGQYTWWVLPLNASQASTGWSDPLSFSIQNEETPPGAVILIGPNGEVEPPVDLTWKVEPHADAYRIWLEGQNLTGTWSNWMSKEELCVNQTCSFTYEALSEDIYTWTVQARNTAGEGPNADPMSFTVANHKAPDQVTLISPNDETLHPPVTCKWVADPKATQYRLWLEGSMDNAGRWSDWINASELCLGGEKGDICLFKIWTLKPGVYNWMVQARNDSGVSPDSLTFQFTIKEETPYP